MPLWLRWRWPLAGGLLLEQRWLLVFGIVFLLEELYETGVAILVLRAAREQGLAARRDRQHGSGRVISLTTTGKVDDLGERDGQASHAFGDRGVPP